MKDEEYMRTALEMAAQGRAQTSPNPMVGAVVVKNGKIIGLGAHLKAGGPHAEVHALTMAGDQAEGAEVYVTLEPCSHYGKTPPCADLLIEKKVSRVIIAVKDPNPLVAGKGIEKLRKAGIKVDIGILEKEALEMNKFFLNYVQTKTPYVTLKSAASLDGKTAAATGESKWITGSGAREDVHRYRESHDGILAGIETVLKDDPSLTCRLPNAKRQPVRIILDTECRIPLKAKVVEDGIAETWVVTGINADQNKVSALEKKGITVLKLDSEKITVKGLLALLGEKGITSLFVEGGSTVMGSFVKESAFNQMILYLAPKLIGGIETLSIVGGEGIQIMADAKELIFKEVSLIEKDIKIIAEPKQEDPSCLQEL
ncbi:bifunctional diaminohydroxyphosphoribosylaminopyrimidine deaminase/5-amino-6-(5-phosphoribosylamino)uracil reductase RibD [Metabacillus sp. RGM 3146]|uniref:bifunctional diaminohydroxyphosphoribosylaminopyrimidine deaminase/5-amino-6-(5-phosphoribosylamino)uracil reductase RibD n=1 Tax=Metabacillus sp. RGM 3146 TaxID=3401092 RepID=UPI003B9C2C96